MPCYLFMRCYPDCEDAIDETFALAATLEPDDSVAVLLHILISNLERMQPAGALQMRDEIVKRFGGRYCRSATCAMMTELIDAHLDATAAKSGPSMMRPVEMTPTTTGKPEVNRIDCSERLPAIDAVVILYSENTGPHQGLYTAEGIWL